MFSWVFFNTLWQSRTGNLQALLLSHFIHNAARLGHSWPADKVKAASGESLTPEECYESVIVICWSFGRDGMGLSTQSTGTELEILELGETTMCFVVSEGH